MVSIKGIVLRLRIADWYCNRAATILKLYMVVKMVLV